MIHVYRQRTAPLALCGSHKATLCIVDFYRLVVCAFDHNGIAIDDDCHFGQWVMLRCTRVYNIFESIPLRCITIG